MTDLQKMEKAIQENEAAGLKLREEFENLPISGLRIGDFLVDPEGFNGVVMYYLTNTDLVPDIDPRLELISRISKLDVVKGFNAGNQRLKECR